MNQHRSPRTLKRTILAIVSAAVLGVLSLYPVEAQISIEPVRWDLPMTVPSPRESNSWFPNLAVDSRGNVHLIWVETYSPFGTDYLDESIYYSMWNGSQWTQYIDIAAPIRDIRRNSLAVDQNDILHMTFIDSYPNNPYRLGYRTAPASRAFSAGAWSKSVYINDRGQSYMNEIATYQDYVYALYEDKGIGSGGCADCSDIYFRQSLNQGVEWETPVNLNPSPVGSSRPHLAVDAQGTIYTSWDEGWDRHSGLGVPQYGVFTMSRDAGETWLKPVEVRYPDNNNAQITIQGDGVGGVMVVWKTTSASYPGVYYIWSTDYGETWTQPSTLPSFLARPTINYFDSYDMAVDSAGHIHLVATGYQVTSETRISESAGLYHFEWDGMRWYPSTMIYNSGLIPEYPRIVIYRGNHLHVSWFVRHDAYNPQSTHEVMYAHGVSSAPLLEQPVVEAIQMISQPEVVSPRQTPTLQVTLRPTVDPLPVETTRSLYSENDEYQILLFSLMPVAAIVGVIILFVRRRQRY